MAYEGLLPTPTFFPPEIGGNWNKEARTFLFNKVKYLQCGWKKAYQNSLEELSNIHHAQNCHLLSP